VANVFSLSDRESKIPNLNRCAVRGGGGQGQKEKKKKSEHEQFCVFILFLTGLCHTWTEKKNGVFAFFTMPSMHIPSACTYNVIYDTLQSPIKNKKVLWSGLGTEISFFESPSKLNKINT